MKNFPHQFNDLDRLRNALRVAKILIDQGTPLTDENFGELLTREQVYTYRNTALSIDEYLHTEKQKPAANRGYHTVSRDIRRFLEILGFVNVSAEKFSQVNPSGLQLLNTDSPELQKQIWKNALMQMGLSDNNDEISHPYRILLKLVNTYPGIDTSKLMLALEARDDSQAEFERISALINLTVPEIIEEVGTTDSMAKNAVKVLPGLAEQLDDIERVHNRTFPIGQLIITEDEITTEEHPETTGRAHVAAPIRQVTALEIAVDPNLNVVSSVSIDYTEAIRIRQARLVEHQNLVRRIAVENEQSGFTLFEGRFDCLSSKPEKTILYEIKTITDSAVDEEKQTIKGIGQLKFYNFSIVRNQMNIENTNQVIVYSRRPRQQIIDFCNSENIDVVWFRNGNFEIYNRANGEAEPFNPDGLA